MIYLESRFRKFRGESVDTTPPTSGIDQQGNFGIILVYSLLYRNFLLPYLQNIIYLKFFEIHICVSLSSII